jgi:molybdopterin converting factor small subunit
LIKGVIKVAKVRMLIYPPLSYDTSTKSGGTLTLEVQFEQGDTLGVLLAKLHDRNLSVWQNIFDAQSNRIRPIVATLVNNARLSLSAAAGTPLSDGDQISFVVAYGGG